MNYSRYSDNSKQSNMEKNIIIIPTYNEKDNVPILLEKIFNLLPDIYALIVDDNSPDGTAKLVEGLTKKYKNLSLLKRRRLYRRL